MDIDLRGRAAVVTGASRGIGRAIALTLAECGADVVVNYRKDEAAATEVVEAIRALGRRALAFQADVADLPRLEEMAEEAVRQFGKIDTLVVNAGRSSRLGTIVEASIDDWDKVLRTNIWGVVHSLKAVVPHIRKQGGSIVLISSVEGHVAIAGHGPYAVTKAGVDMLGRILAKEEAPYGIRVNVVKPGLTATEMGQRVIKGLGEGADEWLRDTTLLGRIGQPVDIARAVAFLASDAASYITSANFRVDGGFVEN